jgi:hypothetical protein
MEENKNNNPGFWDKYGLLILLGVLKIPFVGFILIMIVFYAIYDPIFGPDPIDDSGAVEYRDTTFSVCTLLLKDNSFLVGFIILPIISLTLCLYSSISIGLILFSPVSKY